jgi:hypothetical protein
MSNVAPARIPDSVTICITSCGRLDLLEKTLASFRAFNAGGRFLISEDSTDAAVIAEAKGALSRHDGAVRPRPARADGLDRPALFRRADPLHLPSRG